VKRKVFKATISIIINDEFGSDQIGIKTTLSTFPDTRRMLDERSWSPIHFAIALTSGADISENDVRILLSADPLAMRQISHYKASREEIEDEEFRMNRGPYRGCTPTHILCMQKQPKMSLVKYCCRRDPKAFTMCDEIGRSVLHLVTQYSESLELLQCILQMDSKMTNKFFEREGGGQEITPLGLLCKRLHFTSFDKMLSCLIGVDSSVEVISNGMLGLPETYCPFLHEDNVSESRDKDSLILFRNLLDANPNITKYNNAKALHKACTSLKGNFGIAVLALILSNDSTIVQIVSEELSLPIHNAASYSCLNVLQLLHRAFPESITALDNKEKSLLHLAVADDGNDAAIVIAKVQYLCEQCPALTKLKDHKGYTPLQKLLKMSKYHDVRFNFEIVQYLLCLDGTAVKEMCAPPDTTRADNGQLPLHLICQEEWSVLMTEVSEKGDCFRLLLRLYPAAASIKDGQGNTPYDIAVSSNLSTYFLRLLLAVDPSLDPIQRHDLNFAARREGMFLAFMALSSNYEPSIWANLRYEDKHLLQHVISYL
jgi:hypothetical protein